MDTFLRQIHEFFYTLLAFPRAWRFMRVHRLWEGLGQYRWVQRFLLAVAILSTIYVFTESADYISSHADEPLMAMAIGSDSLLWNLFGEVYDSLKDGALNWIILILLEVVIYHFMRRTLNIILNKNVRDAHNFKPFLEAQKRMIIVSFVALGLQEAAVGILDGFLPDGFSLTLAAALIQAALLGYAIADNYNEQFGLTITQSIRHLYRNYVGICAGLGLPLYLILEVPLLGAMVGPLVTSVTAAIVLKEKSDLHIIGYQMSEKELEKAEKKRRKKEKKAARKARRKGVKA